MSNITTLTLKAKSYKHQRFEITKSKHNFHFYFRFDTELHSLQEELKKEKVQREKTTREKDMAMSDKFSMEQTLSVSFPVKNYNNKK